MTAKKSVADEPVTQTLPYNMTAEELALMQARDATHQRDSALRYALDFHKNNGGMLTPPQLLANANLFLDFIKGESK
jgi:hypothetical protein